MSKKPFDKFINKSSGAKKKEEIRQEKRQFKAELKAKGEEMNRQNEDRYRTVTSSNRRKPADDSQSQSFKSKNQSAEGRSRKFSAGADDFKTDKRSNSRAAGSSSYRPKDEKAGSSFKAGEDRAGGNFKPKEERTGRSFNAKEDNEGRSFKPKGERAGRDFKSKDDNAGGSYKARESRAGGSYKSSEEKAGKPYGREEKPGYKGREEKADKPYSRKEGSEAYSRRRTDASGTGDEKPEGRERRYKAAPSWEEEPRSVSKATAARTAPAADVKAAYDENAPMPLNKYIAHSGICGRREAAELVKEGHVVVNGSKILEPGFKVTASDKVSIKGKQLFLQKNLVYVLLNKPKDYLTTAKDPQGRKTVLDLVKGATQERIFPVGRLDRNTTGVLLLTNDGELAQKLTHPSFEIKKIYEVRLDKPVLKKDLDAIVEGIELEDGFIQADSVGYADSKDKSVVGIEIHSGRNRIVRRIFEHLGYDVKNLDRVLFANLTKKNVDRGRWRMLSDKEVRLLKYMNQSFVKKKDKKDAAK